MADPVDPAELLTLEAQRAIRAYMLKFVIPSAVGLSIISAIVGFLVNDAARGDAYVKAYGEASKSILDTATAASVSRGQAEALLESTKKLSTQVSTDADKVEKSRIEVDQYLAKNFDAISSILIKDDTFRKSLANVSQTQLASLDDKLTKTTATVAQIGVYKGDPVFSYGTASEATTMEGQFKTYAECPTGTFMTGLYAVMDRSRSTISGFKIACRPLNTATQ